MVAHGLDIHIMQGYEFLMKNCGSLFWVLEMLALMTFQIRAEIGYASLDFHAGHTLLVHLLECCTR